MIKLIPYILGYLTFATGTAIYWKKLSWWIQAILGNFFIISGAAIARIILESVLPKLTADSILIVGLIVGWWLSWSWWRKARKVEPDVTTDPVFAAEARRLGRLMLHRQRLFAMPLLLGTLFVIVLFGCIFFVPDRARVLCLCLLTILMLTLLLMMPAWFIRWKRRFGKLPTIPCPICGGQARVESANAQYAYLYLVCPKCGQRANTRFFANFHSLYH